MPEEAPEVEGSVLVLVPELSHDAPALDPWLDGDAEDDDPGSALVLPPVDADDGALVDEPSREVESPVVPDVVFAEEDEGGGPEVVVDAPLVAPVELVPGPDDVRGPELDTPPSPGPRQVPCTHDRPGLHRPLGQQA